MKCGEARRRGAGWRERDGGRGMGGEGWREGDGGEREEDEEISTMIGSL